MGRTPWQRLIASAPPSGPADAPELRLLTVGWTHGPAQASNLALTRCSSSPTTAATALKSAERVDGAWDAVVRIRRVLTDAKPHVERVSCGKVTAKLAETRAVIWAKRWVDLHA